MQQFIGKVALITGAAGNLGRAVAQALIREGASVILIDLQLAGLLQTQAAIGADGSSSLLVPTDLTQSVAVADMTTQALERFQKIDILANIAGGFTMGPPLHDTPDRDWDFMFNLNARSVFYCCRAIIPAMMQQGQGAIINIAAKAALQGQAHMGPYCAAKSAVRSLTESLAAEHRLTGIRVNCILPSIIDTPQNRTAMPEADYSTWVTPTAIAEVLLFLASETASCITGAAIPVYGRV